MTNICKFYLKGNCKQNNNCKYVHDSNICKFFFFNGNCKKGTQCNFSHSFVLNEKGISVAASNVEQSNNIPLSELDIEEPMGATTVSEKQEQNKEQFDSNIQQINSNSEKRNNKRNNNEQKNNNPTNNSINNPRNKSNEYDSKNRSEKNNNSKHKHKKNTENFNPSHEHLDMNILVGLGARKLRANDVVVYPNFLNEPHPNYFYDKLITEMEQSGVNQDDLWKLWHGDSHLIADDHINWKKKVPTFGYIVDEIKRIFKVDAKSTRFNWYRDTKEWKPFHFDAAAVKEDKAKSQNITVGISLGRIREVAFEHAKTRTTICIPLPNNTVYAFSKNVNIEWRHGIPQVPPDEYEEKGRISIIVWGWTEMDDFPAKN